VASFVFDIIEASRAVREPSRNVSKTEVERNTVIFIGEVHAVAGVWATLELIKESGTTSRVKLQYSQGQIYASALEFIHLC
jgi:hypothetical protein